MAMAERGLGVGILPDLILRRIPYRIEIHPLATPHYRQIGLTVTPPPRCRICSHTFFLFLLEIKHIFSGGQGKIRIL